VYSQHLRECLIGIEHSVVFILSGLKCSWKYDEINLSVYIPIKWYIVRILKELLLLICILGIEVTILHYIVGLLRRSQKAKYMKVYYNPQNTVRNTSCFYGVHCDLTTSHISFLPCLI
jgi:hypothetical protein